MGRDFSRSERIAQVIHRDLARMLQYELKDPRITAMVTVSAVKVSRDLTHAKVYISTIQDDQIDETLKLLNKASGFFRSNLAKQLTTRICPDITFVHDRSITEGMHLSRLIDQAIDDDRAFKDKLRENVE